MSNGGTQDVQLQPESAARGLRGMQFSLAGMFVAITAAAVILSIYFGVGKLLGMSPGEVLAEGLGRFLFVAPTMLLWVVGLMIAVRRLRRNRLAAILTMIALGGLLFFAFVSHVAQMALIHAISSNRISSTTISWGFTVIQIIWTVLNTACWILILAAIFARRPPDVPPADERAGGENPFTTDEP